MKQHDYLMFFVVIMQLDLRIMKEERRHTQQKRKTTGRNVSI